MSTPATDVPSELADQLKALSNPYRLQLLEWLKDPEKHFPKQQDADLVSDGVCVGFLTNKVGLSQPTVSAHMQTLAKAGLVQSKKIKNWVYYRPDPKGINAFLGALTGRFGQS
jgi:ArsR family transcriptional regulator